MSKFAALFIALLLSNGVHGQVSPGAKPAAIPQPASAGSAKTPPASKSTDFSKEAFVIEESKTSFRFESDGTGAKTTYGRYRVQSEAALQRLGQLVFGYSSDTERLKIDYVRVKKSDGTVVTAPDTAVQDLTSQVAREAPVYSDYREKHVTVPSLRPGEVLEFQITTETVHPLAQGQFWADYSFEKNAITLDEVVEVNVPRTRQLKLKVKPAYETSQSEQGDRRVYRWKSSNLERPDNLNKVGSPMSAERRKDLERADIQLTTFTSWDEVARWYSALERERRVPSEAVKARAEELTRDKNSDIDKVEAIYDYVSTNFRYVSLSFGTGRYQPHAAGEVLTAQYGDCKDKETLLAAMLSAIGIKTNTVLIHSQRKLDEEVASPSQFDHVIGAIQLGDKLVWIDTTSEVAPFQVLLSPLRDKSALLITPDGAGRIVKTPADLPFAAFQRVDITGRVSELGKLEQHVRYEIRGDVEVAVRMAFRRIPESNWPQVLEYASRVDGMEGEVSNTKISDPAKTKAPLVLEFDLSQVNFLNISSKNSKLSLPFPPMRLEFVGGNDEDDEPLKMGSPTTANVTLKLTFPEKYKLRTPIPVELKREYGEYAASYAFKDGVLTASRMMNLKVRELPASRRSDVKSFVRVLQSDAEQRVSVEGPGDELAAAPPESKAADLDAAAREAFIARNYKLASTLYKRVVELEPRHKTAWNNLGRSYLYQFKLDEAVAAFKKQIEINPYDEYSYNNLGLAYERQEKYEDAIASYRKQLEVNPLDQYSHRNLGLVMSRRHRYQEAIPELQQALNVRPDDPFVQQQIADCYLKSGQTAKAMELFDEVVKKAPNPNTWNNVAFALAEQGVHLDRAQQYAESAVNTTSLGIKNLPDDQLKRAGVAVTAMLATYWDTLGWIYFRQGDLSKAEKFLAPAWNQSQHGEVGDHLGQLFEKRGETQKAIDMYAKALAASQPVPETRGRLAKLLGSEAKVNPLIEKLRPTLSTERTVHLGTQKLTGGASEKGDYTAEVLLIFGESAKAEDVSWLSGTESLKPLLEKLKATLYPVQMPESAATHIVRKGVMWCSKPALDCTLVLELAGEQAQINTTIPSGVLNGAMPTNSSGDRDNSDDD